VDKIRRLSPAGLADFCPLRRVGRVPSVRFYPLGTPRDIEAESGRIVYMIGHSASSQASERIVYKREGIRLGTFTDAVIASVAICNAEVRFHPLAACSPSKP
jgi:hypothetical protein